MKFRFLACLIVLSTGGVIAQTAPRPRNIIIMIGDGMGISQVTAGRTTKGTLALDRFKHLGLLLTHAAGKDYITDSAAGATALATGVKSYNGAIAVGPDKKPVETAMERAQMKGKKTGIVVVCSITHATPACFVAHVPSRQMELDIADQISQGSTDLLLGGGWGWFLPKESGGRRTDGKNLVDRMKERGYVYTSSDSGFQRIDFSRTRKVLGLFAENQPGPAQERKPGLSAMTKSALEALSGSAAGFFLMVEGSQIDWAGHDNKSDQIALEMADFDDAIDEALAFAERDGQTLVVVTADHETGGYSLVGGSLEKHTVEGKFTTGNHTGTMIPLFAFGPGSEQLDGIQQNSNVGRVLLELLGQ